MANKIPVIISTIDEEIASLEDQIEQLQVKLAEKKYLLDFLTSPGNYFQRLDDYLNMEYCCYCGKQIMAVNESTQEYLVPLSWGGVNNAYNKRSCCKTCDTDRRNRSLSGWLTDLEAAVVGADEVGQYNLQIKIANIEYVIIYIHAAGRKLYRDDESFKKGKRKDCR